MCEPKKFRKLRTKLLRPKKKKNQRTSANNWEVAAEQVNDNSTTTAKTYKCKLREQQAPGEQVKWWKWKWYVLTVRSARLGSAWHKDFAAGYTYFLRFLGPKITHLIGSHAAPDANNSQSRKLKCFARDADFLSVCLLASPPSQHLPVYLVFAILIWAGADVVISPSHCHTKGKSKHSFSPQYMQLAQTN